MSQSVAAVVVTHNSAAHIAACVHSLTQAGVTNIVVVDNASSDDTPKVITSLPVHSSFNAINHGFAAATNQGVAQTKSDYILLLNPDAQLAPQALSVALAYVADNAQVGALGLHLVTRDGLPEDFSWGKPVTLLSLLTGRKRSSEATKPGHICGWVSAGAVLIRHTAWVDVNGFDPHFFMYWEDVDLCYRLRAQGWQVTHLATARVIHERGASLANAMTKTRLYDQSADRYFRKHYATPIWLLQRLLRQVYRWWSPVVS